MTLRVANKAAICCKKLGWDNAVDTDFFDKTNELKLQSWYWPNISYTRQTHAQASDVDSALIQRLIYVRKNI
jgi:hypothetical protein